MFIKLSKHMRDHPLGYRLLAYILAFSSVFTLLGTAVQLYWEYRTDVDDIDDILQQIEDSYVGSLTESQWLLDEAQIQAQLNGILRLPEVHHVELRPAEAESVVTVGGSVPERNITRTYDLVRIHRGRPVRLGELVVVATLDGVYARLREKFLVILGTQAVRTFATSLFILFIVQFVITRHLQTLAEYAQRLSLEKLGPRLQLKRADSGKGRPDELDHVVAAFEEMRSRLSDDLAVREAAEAERERLIAELESKNTELEKFSYTASHDLKSPLITIQGFLGLLEKDIASGDRQGVESDLARIQSAADKMFQLVEDLLELSRIGRVVGKLEDVAFGDLAREAVELLAGRLQAGGVRVEIADALPAVHGDRSRLLQVLQNLIDNSAKFMGEQPDPLIEIGVKEGTSGRIFFVKDNGAGIDTAEQENVFDLFCKLDQQVAGTGLGLALVHRIIEVHQGHIWIDSEGPGRGTTVCFSLPDGPAVRD